MRRGVLATLLAALIALAMAAQASAAPPFKHVFIVMLENENADTTFGPGSKAPYLSGTLRAQGAFVPGYFATGHLSLDNYISLISGQGPNPVTQADAMTFSEFLPGVAGPNGQAIGQGAVYPASVQTIADQLDAKGQDWRGYMEDMGNSATESKTCRHPAIGSPDGTQNARQGDQYAARHNPFVYFHSIIDDQARCDAKDVPLDRLNADLSSASTTPAYSFITPSLCHDGHDAPCKGSNEPGGLVSADAFLKQWIPKIVGSPAYGDGGLVIVTFDEAVTADDASSCCGEVQGPNTPNNGGTTQGSGGGRVGAVLLSNYVKPGTVSKVEYNHYSLLRSTEDYFGLSHLGYAAADGLKPFGYDIFTNPTGTRLPSVAKPKVRLSGVPKRCVTRRFRVRVRATGSGLSLVMKVDKRTVRTTKRKKLRLSISVRHVKPGNHRLRVQATDRFGRRAGRSAKFTRCAS
ncbi:MAG: hypothetical protein QOD53_1650 [Thermoleophilaceae bacterium]|nr:hypothetical protein [Thermoleophilaceae bacterium]